MFEKIQVSVCTLFLTTNTQLSHKICVNAAGSPLIIPIRCLPAIAKTTQLLCYAE